MKKIILIPAYKPDSTLTDLVSALSSHGLSVVVVDDGSGEKYRAVFDSAEENAEIVHCAENGGKGNALKKGIAYIRDNFSSPYIVVTADADGQHTVEDILRVVESSARSPGSLVLGCRTISREMPLRNWCGNVYTNVAFVFSTGRKISDTQTGLRGFSDKAVPFMLSIKGVRYEYEMNMLLWWMRCGKPIEEVPIRTLYFGEGGVSHFKAIRDSIVIYWNILKFSTSSLICFFIDTALFALLFFTLPLCFAARIFTANIAARLITSVTHYLWLRFSSGKIPGCQKPSAPRYFLLAAAILALNTVALWGLMSLGMAAVGAKVLVDVAFFFLTFAVQWRWFYKMKRK